MPIADYVAIKELLNESKCAMERARRLANKAVRECASREDAYANACQKVRDLERQLEVERKCVTLWKLFKGE